MFTPAAGSWTASRTGTPRTGKGSGDYVYLQPVAIPLRPRCSLRMSRFRSR